jgi:hypothetical protein
MEEEVPGIVISVDSEHMQMYNDEDLSSSMEIHEVVVEEKNLQVSIHSSDESSKLTEASADQDMSNNSVVYVAEKSLQVAFASQDVKEHCGVCPNDVICANDDIYTKVGDCSVVDVCDEICQVSMSSHNESWEASMSCESIEMQVHIAEVSNLETSKCIISESSICANDDIHTKVGDCSVVDVCDEICQVSMSSHNESQEVSMSCFESVEMQVHIAEMSNLETTKCINSEHSISDSPLSNKSEKIEVDISDKSLQVSFSSPGSDQPISRDSEKSVPQDSNPSEASADDNEDEEESSNSDDEDNATTTQMFKSSAESKSNHQSRLDATVYEDARTSLTGMQSGQNWRSQAAPSSDEDDVSNPKPRRGGSRSSKKQAQAALAKVFDSSNSEDLDDFYNKMKTPAKKQMDTESEDDLSDFIVSDCDVRFETAEESPDDLRA